MRLPKGRANGRSPISGTAFQSLRQARHAIARAARRGEHDSPQGTAFRAVLFVLDELQHLLDQFGRRVELGHVVRIAVEETAHTAGRVVLELSIESIDPGNLGVEGTRGQGPG